MTEEELIDFMDHLPPPKTEGTETAGSSTLPSSPPKLDSLAIDSIYSLNANTPLSRSDSIYSLNANYPLSRSVTAAVLDALSRSGLPFFQHLYKANPAIEAQLKRNQRNLKLGWDSTGVPATSMRLFICGDPHAGKTTLLSTMRSMYSTRKRDKFIRPLFATQGRTRGIEVAAIQREGIRVSLWDMAGQSEFHAFHDCMFPDVGTSSYQVPSMFMFVWSPIESNNIKKGALKNETNFEASFRYWLRFLASKTRQSNISLKVIVVFTRADQMASLSYAFSTQIDSLRSDFRGVIDIFYPPFHVDARKKDSIKVATSVRDVAKHIFDIAKDMLQGIQVYDICTNVNKLLSKHSKNTNEEIITWQKFSEICPIQFSRDNTILEPIAQCLNESGNIIYINGIRHIVLNPNWFCNEVMGSLIHFSNSQASKSTIVFTNGCTPRDSLEECLESVVGSKVKGSLLVDLMEAMHLCCKVAINNGVPNSHVEYLFIPALLTDGSGLEQLRWRSSTKINVDDDTFVYMGRRLECEDKDRTFLTPGLFPRVQVLFNKAFQSLKEEYKANVMLGKDFISICFSNKEIIVVFCQAKSEHVIDVLVQANNPNNGQQCHTSITLADVELKHVINTLVTICAQPTGIQGVKLIESVIRPDCLRYPSRTKDREDQCVQIIYLKQQLKKKLERGEQRYYDFIDLLGSENYEEVLMSCKSWLKEEAENPLLSMNDEVNVSLEQQSLHNVTISEHSLFQEDRIQEEAIEMQTSKLMVKAIGRRTLDRIENKIDCIDRKIDANHKELLMKMDAIHHDLQCLRIDVMTKVEKSISKLLKLAMENEFEKQLPRVVILTTDSHDKNITRLVTSLLGALSVQIQLYCEHETLPHPVINQPGITLTSLSESRLESLRKVLPYMNCFFFVLSTAIKLGINSVAPLASSFIPDWTPHLKLAREHPTISMTIKSKFNRSTSSKISQVCSSTPEYFKEWQKCLAFILAENGGVTDQNIAEKFCLWRAKVDGGTRVAWLCKKHYREQRAFLLS